MPSVHEQLTEQFRQWELRGRGWRVFEEPVYPEPPFVPFRFNPPAIPDDDGRKATFLSSLVQGLSRKIATEPEETTTLPDEEEPEPEILERQAPVELQISLPRDFKAPRQAFGQFLQSVSLCSEPLSFELLGLHNRMVAQLAVGREDLPRVRKQMEAFCPEATLIEQEGFLASAWTKEEEGDSFVFEFGLGHEFMLPLAEPDVDPFVGIAAALNELQNGEVGLFQVLLQPLQRQWAEAIREAVEDGAGKPLFVNAPEITKAALQKASQPLYAVVVRVAVRAGDFDRALSIARDIASALRVFAHPNGNELIPLRNDDYPFEVHVEDMLLRQTRRSGMILALEELLGFVHLPSVEVSKVAREATKTRATPKELQTDRGLCLGLNTHAGRTVEVRLSPERRVQHTHIIGASGTGKSTLFFNLIAQDIEAGEGIAVLDPHGDLIDRILGSIPEERIEDVIVFDPSDEQYPIGFNVLSVHSELEKNLLASDLVSIFQRLSTSWGDQMGSVMQNAILAFVESSRGGTLADMRRFLLEPEFRNEFLQTVKDPEIVYYWRKGFPQLSGNKSIGPVMTRLETFLAPKPIRYMVSQPKNWLDFAHIMDTGKIFLAKLSQGLLGKENSYLLGSLLVSKFQQTAMSRQAQEVSSRRLFPIYLDEFQNFITPSMAEILTGARKYRVGLVLAHQELRQLERDKEMAGAVMSCHTRVVFRVGDDDARKLADGFASFESRDLQNLNTGQAICRVERSDHDFNLSVPLPEEPDAQATDRRRRIITASRVKYGTPRAEVEAMLAKHTETASVTDRPTRQPVAPIRAETASVIPKVSEAPKAPEVPKPTTVSGKESVVERRAEPPRESGRGGAQHQAIQKRIKEAAEKLGFRSTIEKQILDGQGSVDLLLERGDGRIGCEISISTTIDHEVGNVAKCIKAGFEKVAVICVDGTRLGKLEQAIAGSLGPEIRARVIYHQPDSFIAHLHALAPPAPATPLPEKRLGYTIKRSAPKLTAEERRQKEDLAYRAIAETMRQGKK